ncbi:MAG: hypothetical protein AB7U29_17255 [Desulfobulbus sp.]
MDLLQNPFQILTASPRDNRRRIMELADERSLLLDSNDCMQARSDLTNPRKRLSAEVAWLPGIGPKRAGELLSLLESSPSDLLGIDKLTSIARGNLLVAGLSRLPDYTSDDVAEWILEIAWAFEDIEPEGLSGIINEERIVSGFPEVTDLSAVETEIQERRRHYRQVIKFALDNLSAKELVEAVTVAVESATDEGVEHGPILIADLVDSYEVEAQVFLDKEEGNIKVLVERLRTAVSEGQPNSTLTPMVNQLVHVVKNWDTVAQPIQVSTKSRGLDHDASIRVARLVRELSVQMFNEYDKLEFSQQLTAMLQEVFAEVGGVLERASEDIEALDEIAELRKLSSILEPISDACKETLEKVEKSHSHADKRAKEFLSIAINLVSNLESSTTSNKIISQGKDEIAITLMHCAVVFGNATDKWNPCVSILEEALKYAASQDVKSRIEKNLSTVKNNKILSGGLVPISSAPSLYTFNGIGTTLYGSTDHDPASGSYLSTYYFVFLAIPIFPIRRYRVTPTGNGYRFLGKASLRTFDKWHIAISLGLIAWMFLSM